MHGKCLLAGSYHYRGVSYELWFQGFENAKRHGHFDTTISGQTERKLEHSRASPPVHVTCHGEQTEERG